MATNFLRLNDVGAYTISFELSNYIWQCVVQWDYFAKKTVGSQFVEAVDSISANIAEGFGRYTKKDKVKFYRYSFGSTKESLDWNEKAHVRGLLAEEQYRYIFTHLSQLPREINYLIQYTNTKLKI